MVLTHHLFEHTNIHPVMPVGDGGREINEQQLLFILSPEVTL